MRNACPICGREMHVPQHRKGRPWTPQSIIWINHLRAVGLPIKAVANLMGVSRTSVASKLNNKRERRIPDRLRNGRFKGAADGA